MTDPETSQRPVAPPPRFCPRCGVGGRGDRGLCDECGETLIDQGFCPVCERFWRHRVDEPCPKHDVPLEPGPEPSQLTGERIDWVTVASYPETVSAHAARIRLEAEGVPTFLEGERMGGHGAFQIATGGMRLQVPRDLAGEARIVLSQTWAAVEEEGEDLDEDGEDLAPVPWEKRRAIMRSVLIFLLLLPVIHAMILWLTGR